MCDTGNSKGKGKGKSGPPPPPSSAEAAKAQAELQQKRREQMEREKREAQEDIAQTKELEAKQRDLQARLPTLRSHDIAEVPWDAALLTTHLCGGKGTAGIGHLDAGDGGGVDVVELPCSTAVCIRKGPCIVTESIADSLAAALDVRIARMRLVQAGSDESRRMMDMARRFTPASIMKSLAQFKKRLETMDEETPKKMRAVLNPAPACGVLEFVPGASLDTASIALQNPSMSLLAGIGQLCGLDVLLNNMDRIPLPCWGNAGNLTNAIVTQTGELVGIDQQVNRIEPGPGLDEYLSKVRALSTQVLQGRAADAAASISTAIKNHCGVELSDNSMGHVIEGMGNFLRKTAQQAQTGSLGNALKAAVARVEELNLPCDIAANDVAFVQQVVDVVVEVAADR